MPGTANISSGYTSRLQSKAVNCDQAQLLARLQDKCCDKGVHSTAWPPASSTLELKAQASCGNPTDALVFPKKATLSSVYTRSVQERANDCKYRFSEYLRIFPCCPPHTITNAGMAKPSLSCSQTSDQNLNTKIT